MNATARSVLFFAIASLACTTTTTDNFQNPPIGIPSTCAIASNAIGCGGGSSGYACASDRPDDGDTSLVCSRGTPGDETTIFCCLPYAQAFTECVPSIDIDGCEATAFGFSCSGESTPADADSSLNCSAPIATSSGTNYCCVAPALSPECVIDTTLACGGASVGYACSGDARPVQPSDAMIACSVGTAGESGSTTYCCVPFTQSDCIDDPNVAGCEPGSYGFSCAALHRPEESNSALACTGNAPSYCCSL